MWDEIWGNFWGEVGLTAKLANNPVFVAHVHITRISIRNFVGPWDHLRHRNSVALANRNRKLGNV